MVNFLFAVETSIGCWALAVVSSIWVVDAATLIEAWSISTVHGAQLTVLAIVSRRTGTGVGVLFILFTESKRT